MKISTPLIASLCMVVLATWPAHADGDGMTPAERFDRVAPRIVNGTLTSLYPTTGALLTPGNPSTGAVACSGTLIGCETFLTAAHCVCDTVGADCQGVNAPNPASFVVFLQHAGFFAVSSIVVRSDYDFPVGDVAIIKLATPVAGISPSTINTVMAPASGTTGTIAGFGRSGGGGGNADYGLKRAGKVVTTTCNGVSNTTSVCWDFADPLGPPGEDSNTCNGDSGGPLFIDFGSGETVAGITSGGASNTCLAFDHSYDANVFPYASWIQTQGGADLANTSCGTIPQVGEPTVGVVAASGSLSSGTPQATHTFEVASGTEVLRVAMNAIDDGPSDFDLYVKAGAPPTILDFDCRQNGPNQFAFCTFDAPVAGTWHVLVQRFAGAGTYQLTVSTFGAQCPPGSDGEPCDDQNGCTADDVCQAGACAGAPANGTPCDDGDVCTNDDACMGGACAGTAAPAPSCHVPSVPQKSLLQLTERPTDTQDRLQWKWQKGSITPKADFGNPVATNGTSYALCVYDAAPSLIMSAAIPAGGLCGATRPRPCWKATSKGFRYTDKDLTPSGIRTVTLREGLTPGKASILVKGRGALLDMPSVPIASLPVTVQLKNSDGECWQAVHGPPVNSNDSRGFKSKGN